VIRRKSPPPSKSFWDFSVGFMVLILASVRGVIRLGIGFHFIFGGISVGERAEYPYTYPQTFRILSFIVGLCWTTEKEKGLISQAFLDSIG